MTALLEGLKYNWLVCRKQVEIEKVKGSQDDGLVGVSKNIPVGCAKNKKNQKSHILSG
jgi:hypothetical protein